MTIREIAETLDATWLCCEEEGGRVLRTAFASDMMSDVLACVTEDTLLLTGLVNGQCVRTCEMLDVPCVVFVRSKEPLADALELSVVELLRGDVSGENAVCLTFKNISRVTLTALEVHFKCKGVDGVILCEDRFEYRDLEVKPGELFGMDDACLLYTSDAADD